MKRYEQYAEEIAELIRTGVLRAGDRLPSVRQASSSRRISPATVFEAYYRLEARGLIQARPRSGYYVSAVPAARAAEPATALPSPSTTEVEISELVFDVLGSTRRPDVVPLGSAFPSPALFPLDRLARTLTPAMRRLDAGRIVEELTTGSEALRRQIGLRYAVGGTAVDARELVVTDGAMEALNLCLQAVTRPGDVVAIESPCFYAALQALERLQLRAVEVATHPRHGVELASLAEVLARHPVKACWFMPSFQNPLGSLMPEANKRALVELLARHGVPLIEDDVYGELHFGARRPPPAKAFDRDGLVMHCSSFSKCLAPGYRVGWTAAGRFAPAVQRLKLMTTLTTAVPSQEALAAYLQQGGYERHLRQLRQALAGSQARMLDAVGRYFPAGTRITRPEGGYFLWVELPPPADALQLQRLAAAHDISLAPGHLFSADRRFARCLRLNYGNPGDARVEEAVRTLGRLVAQLRV
ncbi:GntR family transcriptional regulator [Rubrivivax gelatinosus]|uniref:aminotransferase class I/II-fold pyridoxal phosphate-dependent enzyme n=1 Tax=Rubrivivax gelatinosus TaxID=28068 RepID=UPI00190728F6|nr:GntR family transcriptional regulator [Rubrivivax gelatinosus]